MGHQPSREREREQKDNHEKGKRDDLVHQAVAQKVEEVNVHELHVDVLLGVSLQAHDVRVRGEPGGQTTRDKKTEIKKDRQARE